MTEETPNPFAGEQWDEWINMRRKRSKMPTPYAIKLAVRRLAVLQSNGHDPGEVLDQSTLNGWTGLFEVKNGNRANSRGQSNGHSESADAIFAARRALGIDRD